MVLVTHNSCEMTKRSMGNRQKEEEAKGKGEKDNDVKAKKKNKLLSYLPNQLACGWETAIEENHQHRRYRLSSLFVSLFVRVHTHKKGKGLEEEEIVRKKKAGLR